MHSMFQRCWRTAWTPSSIYKYGVRFSSGSAAFFVRPPSKTAPREVPTPLVFVSASSWDRASVKGMDGMAAMLSEQGFTCIQADLPLPESQGESSAMLMNSFESELSSAIRLSTIPFPPVIFARSGACLIAQTYVSSHPASGLVLISPPPTNSDVPKAMLPSGLKEFDFEPKFPIAVMATTEEIALLKKTNRLCQDPGVDVIEIEDHDGQKTFIKIQEWLDKLGI